jgi:hypothetical protein
MSTPPDFGGTEIEKGLQEEFGIHPHGEGRADPARPAGEDDNDNEARAPGETCARCGALIRADQDVRRRPDGRWVHDTCPLAV